MRQTISICSLCFAVFSSVVVVVIWGNKMLMLWFSFHKCHKYYINHHHVILVTVSACVRVCGETIQHPNKMYSQEMISLANCEL